VKSTVCKVIKIHKTYIYIYTHRSWMYWMVFRVVYSYFHVDFCYYSYTRVCSVTVSSVTAGISPCSLLYVCPVCICVRVWMSVCSNAGFAILDIHRCGSVGFWFPLFSVFSNLLWTPVHFEFYIAICVCVISLNADICNLESFIRMFFVLKWKEPHFKKFAGDGYSLGFTFVI
jgi:hypothetical protein